MIINYSWPDFGVGKSHDIAALCELTYLLLGTKQIDNRHLSSIINCRAGLGRTGTFALIFNCFLEIKKTGQRIDIKTFTDILEKMRSQRNAQVVQQCKQLVFAWDTVKFIEDAIIKK